jgi:hypothetical protein
MRDVQECPNKAMAAAVSENFRKFPLLANRLAPAKLQNEAKWHIRARARMQPAKQTQSKPRKWR